MKRTDKIEVGDFIEIPIWKTTGMIVCILSAEYGSENVQHVLVQEEPESIKTTRYHLEPNEYIIFDR